MRSLSLAIVLAVTIPAAGFAQAVGNQPDPQQRELHSVLQKTGLTTLAVTGVLGFGLMVNRPTLFGDGRCQDPNGEPVFGRGFGCGMAASLTHFAFAATTLGLFVASEVVAATMENSPYDTASPGRADAERALRGVNIGLFAVQPVLGLIAAHPGLIGIPAANQAMFSRVLRTVHFGVGLGAAAGYTVNAALQW